ncbi:lysophospholipid acyltransferase family protein [Clostridium sp. DL1XJH146]
MIKILWYTYFAFFVLFQTIIMKTKIFFTMKKSPELAEEYIFNKAKKACVFILKKTKTKTNVIGSENIPDGPCLFVSNHQAIFDGFLIYANINKPAGFIVKKEARKIPVLRNWFDHIHSVFIDRSNIREGVKAINQGIENLKNGYSMIIFPEGTRSLKSEMIDFKKGSMKLALKAKVPIVPITVNGTYNVLEVGNNVTGNSTTMVVHKPIYTDTLSTDEKKNLSTYVHNIIEASLEEIVHSSN